MFETINTKLDTIFQGLTGEESPLQVVYGYPIDDISGYPCAVYYPSSFENVFETNKENFKTISYKIFIILEAEVSGVEGAYSQMAEVLDSVIQEFDEEWDQGETTDHHRLWWRMSSGDWVLSNTKDGLTLSAELNLVVKLLNDI